jgi:hypothetical protein
MTDLVVAGLQHRHDTEGKVLRGKLDLLNAQVVDKVGQTSTHRWWIR